MAKTGGASMTNCAWCDMNTDDSDSHGICDGCMQKYFGIAAQEIHDEIANESLIVALALEVAVVNVVQP